MILLDDTIAAIATPPGEGGIGVVRLSGPQALSIAAALFRPSRPLELTQVPSHTLHHGHVESRGRRLDEVLVAVMRAPHSYTREDVVELQAHGSPLVLRSILEAVLERGARLARPGEFTQRAFLHGRLSLDQAQAVLDLIQAKTRLSAHLALERLEGRLSQPLRSVRDQLLELLAGVSVGLDYPEYEEDALPREELGIGLKAALQALDDVLVRSRDGRIMREGFSVAIVGRPNVGKSTLLNALLRSNRAIVTDRPGTTRDTLEEWVALQGVPFRLVDTAGLRSGVDGVERLGVERARAALHAADLVLLLLDASAPLTAADRQIVAEVRSRPHLVVLNKADLPPAQARSVVVAALDLDPTGVLEVSARRGDRLDQLEERLARWAWGGQTPRLAHVLCLDVRERDLLRRGRGELKRALETASSGGPLDLVAAEIQATLGTLGELSGESVSEAAIERVFSQFCVGK